MAHFRYCSDCGAYSPARALSDGAAKDEGYCCRRAPSADADDVTARPRVSEICGCAESIPMTKKQLAFRAARTAAEEWSDVLRTAKADCPDLCAALADAEVIAIGGALVVRLPSAEALATAREPLHEAWLFRMAGLVADGELDGVRLECRRRPKAASS